MLKRANISLMSAVLPGFLAYTGWVDMITPAAKFIALALLGFSAISFLLALFEDEDLPAVTGTAPAAEIHVPILLSDSQIARVAP